MKKKKKKLEASYANPQRCFTTCKVHVTLEIATTIRYDSTQQNWLTLDLNMYTTNPKKKKKKKKKRGITVIPLQGRFQCTNSTALTSSASDPADPSITRLGRYCQ